MFATLRRRDIELAILPGLIAAILLGATWVGGRRIETHMIRQQAEQEVFNWARFVELRLRDIDDILLYGRVSREDEALIAALADANNVLRYRFYNRAGFVVLSSEAGEVGRRDVNSYFSEVVISGGTFMRLLGEGSFDALEPDRHGGVAAGTVGTAAGDFELRPGSVLAKASTAVMEDGRFDGAIEVHVDLTRTATIIRRILGFARWIMSGLVMVLAVASAFAIRRYVRGRDRELAEVRRTGQVSVGKEAELRALNTDLERRVADQAAKLKAAQVELLRRGASVQA